MQKYVPLVKQNVMELEVFILGVRRTRNISEEVEREKRGSRERIEIERKEKKGN